MVSRRSEEQRALDVQEVVARRSVGQAERDEQTRVDEAEAVIRRGGENPMQKRIRELAKQFAKDYRG